MSCSEKLWQVEMTFAFSLRNSPWILGSGESDSEKKLWMTQLTILSHCKLKRAQRVIALVKWWSEKNDMPSQIAVLPCTRKHQSSTPKLPMQKKSSECDSSNSEVLHLRLAGFTQSLAHAAAHVTCFLLLPHHMASNAGTSKPLCHRHPELPQRNMSKLKTYISCRPGPQEPRIRQITAVMPWLLVPTKLLQQQLHLPRPGKQFSGSFLVALMSYHRISCDLFSPYCTYILQSNPHVSSSKSSSVQGYDAKACIVPARSLLCRLAAFSATSKVDPQGKTVHEYEMMAPKESRSWISLQQGIGWT